MTLTQVARIANLPYRRKFFQVKLGLRLQNNTIAPDIDITRHVKDPGISRLKKSVDSNDFDIGFFEETNITITVDDSRNRFMEGRGFFRGGIIDGSIIRLVAGYVDPEDGSNETEVSFEGIIESKGTKGSLKKDERKFVVLSFSSVIRKIQSKSGAITAGQTFKDAFMALFTVEEVTKYLTVDVANINPKLNLTIDDATFFVGKPLIESVSALLLASNSIMTITDNEIDVLPRDETPTVQFEYFGKGSATPSNIMDITNQNDGNRRVLTSILFRGDVTPFDADQNIIDRFSYRQKTLDLGFITDPIKKATISLSIITEFQIPKPELLILSPYLGKQIDIMSLVTIDNPGYTLDVNPTRRNRGFKYNSGATYVTRLGGIRYKDNIGWKVLSVEHDFNKWTTLVKLRQKGNQIGDNIII